MICDNHFSVVEEKNDSTRCITRKKAMWDQLFGNKEIYGTHYGVFTRRILRGNHYLSVLKDLLTADRRSYLWKLLFDLIVNLYR